MTDINHQISKATEALQSDRTTEAYFALKRVLKREPGHPDAVMLMAEIHLREGKLAEAAWLARELAARLEADNNAARNRQLADICLRCELWFDAARLYSGLCDSEPGDESLRYRAGLAFYRTGQLETSKVHFEKCAELRPEHPASYLQMGHIDRALRNFQGAEENYKAYLARSENGKASGFWSLSDLRRYRFTDDLIADMHQYLEASKQEGPEASITHFALGIAAEQRENYESAYRHFHSANEIQTGWRPFRADAFEHLIEGLLKSTPPSAGVKTPGAERPIFIVGLPRSGTTLVEQILAAHSSLVATDELPYMERIALELERSGGYGQKLSSLSAEQAAGFRARYIREVKQHVQQEGARIIDKNPNNFLHIGLIRRLMPEALIINLQRDIRDNAFSIYRQFFSVGHDYSARFEDIETYAGQYLRIMSHWLDHYPDAIRVQSYEDLVTDPDTQIAELLEFCGLESEPACFEFYNSRQAVKTPSAGQVSRPMYTSSIGQWRNYETWLSDEFSRLADMSETQHQ